MALDKQGYGSGKSRTTPQSSVGKPLRTPAEVLYSIEGDSEELAEKEPFSFDVEKGGLDPFEEQQQMMDELGIGTETENSDGSVTVDFGEEDEDKTEITGDFGQNLAEALESGTLNPIAEQLIQDYEDDKSTRKEWEETLARGMKLLGMAVEERNDPWAKACGIFHPVLLEAVVRGWAKSVKDLAPARGPAKAELKSKKKGVSKRLRRVTQELNCIVQHDIPGYAEEQSRLAFMTHLSGSGFKKTYFNSGTKKIEDRYVHPMDLVMPYGTTDLDMCPRICHRQTMFPTEVLSMMHSGAWRKIGLQQPMTIQREEAKEEADAVSGQAPPITQMQREILEFHVDLNIPGDPLVDSEQPAPYLIVVDKTTREVLNMRRNWREDDPEKKRKRYFTGYNYITGYSVYGIGMVHMIGGLAEGGTQILRQLVDAGTLSNLPAGFKSRGFRVRNDDKPLKPGEWRDVDFPGQRIEDAIMPLPFKEPSLVLAGLLDKLVEEARRTASSIDAAVSDIGKEAPVGSVLAILEESLVIQNSVKIGMLRSLTRELDIILEIVRDNFTEYRYDEDEEQNDFAADFASPLRVVPSCDPNASSMAQKVVAYREAINTAQTAPPNTYDMKQLHRSFLDAMELPDAEKIVALDEDLDPHDPVSENMSILTSKPLKVFDHQDHESHIAVHMSMLQDPKIMELVGQSPTASAIQGAMAAHIAEHVAYAYRGRIEQMYGQALPDPENPLPAEIERALAPKLAQAAQQVLQQSKQEAQQKAAEELAKDPLVQIKERQVAVQEREVERKANADLAKIELQRESNALDATIRLIENDATVDQNKKQMVLNALLQIKNLKVQATNASLQHTASLKQIEASREAAAANRQKQNQNKSGS